MSDDEARAVDRKKMVRSGRVTVARSGETHDCLIINMSTMDAKLLFKVDVIVPDEFNLLVINKIYTRDAVVKWRKGKVVGVYFTSGPVRSHTEK